MVKIRDKKDTVHIKKPKQDIEDGSKKSKDGLNNYLVEIKYQYLTKATGQQEAIAMAMDRLLGRRFGQVHFDGMVTHAEITKKEAPVYIPPVSKPYYPDEMDDFNAFEVRQPQLKTKGGERYGISIDGDRADSKEQKHINFDSTDVI